MPRPTVFFVCGVPKSGTTWVQLLLNRHPNVSCSGESHLDWLIERISKLIKQHNRQEEIRNRDLFEGIPGFDAFPVIDEEDERWLYGGLIVRMLLKSNRKPGARAVGDKTPDIAQTLRWFHRLVPGAKFLHIVRDPRDVVVSAWHHYNRVLRNRPEGVPEFATYLSDVAGAWEHTIMASRAAAGELQHRYLEIRYEDLSRDPDETLARMLRFLGVPWDPAIRRHCIAGTRFDVLTGGRPAGQEDRGSFFRKGIVGDWRTVLTAEHHSALVARLAGLMVALGYDPGWRPSPPVPSSAVVPAAEPMRRRGSG